MLRYISLLIYRILTITHVLRHNAKLLVKQSQNTINTMCVFMASICVCFVVHAHTHAPTDTLTCTGCPSGLCTTNKLTAVR